MEDIVVVCDEEICHKVLPMSMLVWIFLFQLHEGFWVLSFVLFVS